MHDDIEDTINTWNRHISPKKENVEKLISSLSKIDDIKTKIETLFKISKEFKILSALSQSKKNMIESMCKLYNRNENKRILALIEEFNDFQWKTIFYQENGRRLIKNMNLVPPNYGFFNDIYSEYFWFIEEKKEVREQTEMFELWCPTPSSGLNIIINNLTHTQSGIRLILNAAEESNNLKDLFLYSEIMGDLYLLKFLLTKKVYNQTAGFTHLYFAIKSYEDSVKFKYLMERKEVFHEGIVGYEYQDILSLLLNEEGYRGSLYNVNNKLQFIKQLYPYDIKDITLNIYDEKQDLKGKIFEKINVHLEKVKMLESDTIDSHDTIWKLLLEHLALLLIQSYNNSRYLRLFANEWDKEKDMQEWFDNKFYELEAKYDLISFHKESEAGGGACEHFINNIPIEDKIIDKSNYIQMEDFLEEQYKEHYLQVRQYALGKESRYAVILIVDRRQGIKNGNISTSAPHNCISFRYSQKDKLWCAILVFQVFLKSPSKLKT